MTHVLLNGMMTGTPYTSINSNSTSYTKLDFTY